MVHTHHPHHKHSEKQFTDVTRAFYIGIGLNVVFVLFEAIAGFAVHSLALISDAGHNLADVTGLVLSLLSLRMMKVKSNEVYTYGYQKSTILVALFNSIVLLVSLGVIVYEAIHRFFQPQPLPGITIALVAGAGIVINSVSALMFFRNKEKEINTRAAYLHMATDAVLSLGVVLSGILIYYTNWFWIDPAISILLAVFILYGTWNLLRSSVRLSLDAVPENISLSDIKEVILKVDGVKNVHHVHIWSMSSTENALTAHIVIDDDFTLRQAEDLKQHIKHALEGANINHATLEFETMNAACETGKA